MDKPLLDNQETWSLIKWAFGIMITISFTLSRWFFGDIRDVQKAQGLDIKAQGLDIAKVKGEVGEIKVSVAEIRGDLKALADIKEYLHTLKNNSAFQKHVDRQTKKHNKKIKRLEKKIEV